ncbi:MAG: hypothetical protein PVF95_08080 [bacterium]|jgi:hypothetical protein
MVKKSLVLFLILSFVTALTLLTLTNACWADDDAAGEGGDPGQINPSCEPVTPTPIILKLFWYAVGLVAGSLAAML